MKFFANTPAAPPKTAKPVQAERAPEPQAEAPPPADVDPSSDRFVFDGIELHARLSEGRWRLSVTGHEVVNAHLGTAVRILFDPRFHAETSPLIKEILAREELRAQAPTADIESDD